MCEGEALIESHGDFVGVKINQKVGGCMAKIRAARLLFVYNKICLPLIFPRKRLRVVLRGIWGPSRVIPLSIAP